MNGCIVITPERIYEGEEEVVETITSLGSRVHIRKPNSDMISLRNYCDRILKTSVKTNVTLNRERELAMELGIGGIHTPFAAVENNCKEASMLVSCSTHSFEEAQRADEMGVSYYFLSPIFDSISKQGYLRNFDDSSLREFTSRYHRCVALGGVEFNRLEELTHFYSIALLGAVWQIEGDKLNISKSIEQFKKINDRWQELKGYTI